MITSIIADYSTDYIRRHITQEINQQRLYQGFGFTKGLFCIRKDGWRYGKNIR